MGGTINEQFPVGVTREMVLEQQIRDLKAELARLQRNEDCVQRLIVWAAENGWNGVDNSKILDSFIVGLFDELRAELAAAKNRGDGLYLGLRQTLEAFGGVAQPGVSEAFLILGVPGEAAAIKRLNTALAAHVERLEKALKTIAEDGIERSRDPRTLIAQAALAATPAQSLAAHDAALLRKVADGVNKIAVVGAIDTPQSIRDLIADAIRAKADRIEKEAANG